MKEQTQKLLTDVHTHSSFSFDGEAEITEMFAQAQKLGICIYGVSEHFDFDMCEESQRKYPQTIDEDEYFHTARHLQEDYAGVMNVLVGAEFGYSNLKKVQDRYALSYEKHRPDFVVNSVHSSDGWDYYYRKPYYNQDGSLREKEKVLREYFSLVRESLDAPYPYDIVAHIGYGARYGEYEDKEIRYGDYQNQLDDILKVIVGKGKILEASGKKWETEKTFLTELFKKYFEFGGRKVSYASDAHRTWEILRNREEVVKTLKEIGFTYITVPCNGEEIKVEI